MSAAEGEAQLCDAAKSGDEAAARAALDDGAPLESRDAQARAPACLLALSAR
jgi:hypothetical protein